jgi:TFIIF-interacting CTD phosphatase-like protein
MSQHYELVIFTAGIPDLANKVIDKIDPEGLIKHRIFREHCIEVQFSNRIYLKNLNLLNRRLQDVVLMDVHELLKVEQPKLGITEP